jgi:hypothetical protein
VFEEVVEFIEKIFYVSCSFAMTYLILLTLLIAQLASSFSPVSFKARNYGRILNELHSTAEDVMDRTFANYIVYKSKAAVSLKIIPPTFQAVGTSGRSQTVSREGGLLFTFANTVGPREYDWMKKGTFLLAAAECGELLLLDSTKPGLEFFHDPNMGGANAGQVTKKLKLTTAVDGKGVYLSLAVNDKATQGVSYSVPISWGELQVFKSIADYSIPRILGFDKV